MPGSRASHGESDSAFTDSSLSGLMSVSFPEAKLVNISVLQSPSHANLQNNSNILTTNQRNGSLILQPSLELPHVVLSKAPPFHYVDEFDKVLDSTEDLADQPTAMRDTIHTSPSDTLKGVFQNPEVGELPSLTMESLSSNDTPQNLSSFKASHSLSDYSGSQDSLDGFPKTSEIKNDYTDSMESETISSPLPSTFEDITETYPAITTIKTQMRTDNLDSLDPDQITTTSTYHSNSLSTVTRTATVLAHFVEDLHINGDSLEYSEDQETLTNTPTQLPTTDPMTESTSSDSIQTFPVTRLPLDKLYTDEMIGGLNLQDLETYFTPEITVSITSEFSTETSLPTFDSPVEPTVFTSNSKVIEKTTDSLRFPVLENPKVNTSIGNWEKIDHSSAILLAAVASCALVLLIFTVISLWALRRNKNHSKVYLNYELSKHKSYITRPMQPGILANEVGPSSLRVIKHKPRPPVLLIQELETQPTVGARPKISTSESCDSGIDNLAFIDPSYDGQSTASSITKSTDNIPRKCRPVPKFTARIHKKRMQNAAVLMRVCSSDGSIFPTSPSLTKCFVPPPPYSPNIKDKDFNLSLNFSQSHRKDSQTTLSSNSETTTTSDGSPSDTNDKVIDTIIDLT